MLKRKAMTQLESWRENEEKKCLIVSGARQVGKTFIIEKFGRKNYPAFFELNFLMVPSLGQIFEGNLDADTVLTGIRLSMPQVKYIEGSTLIFLDEIQECPNAITALKFLASDSRFDVICSGSALGMVYKQVSSYPVGYVDYLDMHSLDFEEFLWAMEIDADIIELLKKHLATRTRIPDAINNRMMQYFRQYIALGGMPEVINIFRQTNDYAQADATQRRIYRDYLADIAHYAAPEIKIKAENCYKSIPMQLMKDNHKFQYSVVEKKGTARKFENSVGWLSNAHMTIACNNVGFVEYPLKAHELENNMRLYPNDIGLLTAAYDFSLKKALLNDTEDNTASENIVLKTAKGGIWEAVVAEMLTKAGHKDLHFYRNESGQAEMEFFIENKDGIIPVEVKAGKSRTRSLDNLLKKEDIKYGYKLASQNIGVSGKKITLPAYMAAWL